MAAISHQLLADAVVKVTRMSMAEKEALADQVHARQPNLFYSVLVLKNYGASFIQIEVVLNMLFVFYLAMTAGGKTWPLVSEDVQEQCLKRVTGRVWYIEGLTPEQQNQATADAIADHPEQLALAFVFGEFKAHGMLGIKTEAEKMAMFAALNLVECIAAMAPS